MYQDILYILLKFYHFFNFPVGNLHISLYTQNMKNGRKNFLKLQLKRADIFHINLNSLKNYSLSH